MAWRPRGSGAERIMRSAVGGMNVLRTPVCAITANASSGSKRSKRRAPRARHRAARQQAVEQPAGPRPVGRRPHAVAGLGKELVRHLDAGLVADQHPVRVQRALGLAGGA